MVNKHIFGQNLSPALEDYLEAISALKREKKYARVGDIARTLNVKSSSANTAINQLAEDGLAIHERYGYVDLTDQGEEIAQKVQKKHDILYMFLNDMLFVEPQTAVKEACSIEHSISSETIHKLERLYILLKKHFLTQKEDTDRLKEYLNKV
ncbi:MAG: metal-dependent transcriptional regulator [Elusimicrobiota bacterium]|nr:metal-dependent transcriptional regulator [Elusimicrobiota bacterium]